MHADASRSGGRHRRELIRRHRALPMSGERGRTVLLTATLGAALVTGVAGGTAAAAAERDARLAPAADAGAPAYPSTSPAQAEPSPHSAGSAQAEPSPYSARPAQAEPSTHSGGQVQAEPWRPADQRGWALAARKKPRPAAKPRVAAAESRPDWVNPLPGAVVTSCFGPRWGRLHAGVDVATVHGTPVVAVGAGAVVRAGEAAGYGNAVLIDHGDGYLTHYGHLAAITVREGERVAAGGQIGTEGSTGHSTGPHLHFEVHQGTYKNPIEPTGWLRARGVVLPGC